jgi:hypothetical protein
MTPRPQDAGAARSRRPSANRGARTRALLLTLTTLGGAGCLGGDFSLGIDCLLSGTGRELQAALDTQSRVLLCQRAVFTLDAVVILRANQTLETVRRPSQPADMATIILGPEFANDSFGVGAPASNITIRSVRFDGNRRTLGARPGMQLVAVGPGKNYQLIGNSFTDTPGWTHLHIFEDCTNAQVTGNTVESALRAHGTTGNADGFSIACADALIADNTINDVTGGGIVYYGFPNTVIRNNVIVQSMNNANSGINVGDAIRLDHTNVVIEQNIIKAVSPHFFHLGIAAGLRIWVPMKGRDIKGVTVRDNTIIGMSRYGLAVDGCVDCVIKDNQIRDWQPLLAAPGCPAAAPYVASVTAGHAGGMLQPGFVDVNVDGCLGPPSP